MAKSRHAEFIERIEHGDYSEQEVEYMRAVDRYRRKHPERRFMTATEFLWVARELGYERRMW